MTALVAAVLESRTVLGNWLRLQVRQTSGQWFCQPGQFFLLRCGDSWSPYLRRPLFPTLGNSDNLTFLIPIGTDSALDWLAGQPLGAPLDLVGPLGNGVSIHAQQRRLLLVGEGAATVSLLALIGPQLDRDASVGLLLQAESRTGLLPAQSAPTATPRLRLHPPTASAAAARGLRPGFPAGRQDPVARQAAGLKSGEPVAAASCPARYGFPVPPATKAVTVGGRPLPTLPAA